MITALEAASQWPEKRAHKLTDDSCHMRWISTVRAVDCTAIAWFLTSRCWLFPVLSTLPISLGQLFGELVSETSGGTWGHKELHPISISHACTSHTSHTPRLHFELLYRSIPSTQRTPLGWIMGTLWEESYCIGKGALWLLKSCLHAKPKLLFLIESRLLDIFFLS